MVLALHDMTRSYILSLSFANCRFLWKRKQAQQYKSTWRRSSPFQLILQYAELQLSIKKHKISLIFFAIRQTKPQNYKKPEKWEESCLKEKKRDTHTVNIFNHCMSIAMSVFSNFLLSYVFCWFIDSLSHSFLLSFLMRITLVHHYNYTTPEEKLSSSNKLDRLLTTKMCTLRYNDHVNTRVTILETHHI